MVKRWGKRVFGFWDNHGQNFRHLKRYLPLFDQGISALVEDVYAEVPWHLARQHRELVAERAERHRDGHEQLAGEPHRNLPR